MAQFELLRPATVLVVEDDVIVQAELVDWLADLGLTVLAADNADEAIVLLDRHPEVSLLLTDIQMPGSMDGIRLAHHVARQRPPVKIIVLSGRSRTELSELPPDSAFIAKPYQPSTLWSALSTAMA